MQEFYINKDATLPLLKMELINDGRHDYNDFYELIQSGATITFTMTNVDTGVVKIANKPVFISPKEDVCGDEYFIYYKWEPRDTKLKGTYDGKFTITFSNGDKLIVPIQEPLIIYIQ